MKKNLSPPTTSRVLISEAERFVDRNNRIKTFKIIYFCLLALVIGRLYYWQVVKYDDLAAIAEKQHLTKQRIEASRGTIYSSDGAILATNKPTYLLFGLPKEITNKDLVASSLSKILISVNDTTDKTQNLSEDELNKYLDVKDGIKNKLEQDLYWVPLKKNLDHLIMQKIAKLQLNGIGFDEEQERFYPESSSAAHLMGFVGANASGSPTGYFGIEGYYDRELKGMQGVITEEKDAKGLPILIGQYYQKEAEKGFSLVLNIDRAVQYIAERNLLEGVRKFGAKSASVIVMEPNTGAILAMASYPNYNPNDFLSYPREYYKNPVVADTYEPGSTFKVLVMAAALNEKVLNAETKCDICSGPVQIGGFLIRTWNNKYNADTDMTNVIIHSDNTGMVFAARKLGLDKLYKYTNDFGFGSPTQIDLQDEIGSFLRPKNEWKDIDLATASFGQGIAVTPMQMIRAVATIANGGYLLEPHVVKSILTDDQTIDIKTKVVANPISKETAQKMTSMMVQAVEKGEAKAFAPAGFKIAGKTGTAQIPVAGHYDPTKTIASFVGFAPSDNPKFVILVRYQEPSASIFGAETAAPTFFNIAKELFIYYNISPF